MLKHRRSASDAPRDMLGPPRRGDPIQFSGSRLTPLASPPRRRVLRGVMLFLAGLSIGALAGAFAMNTWFAEKEHAKEPGPTEPARALSSPLAPTPATENLPPQPRIRPVFNPGKVPRGPGVSPEGPGGLFKLPGNRGRFSYKGLSFRYPPSWEMVVTNGYIGLVGNNLWIAPIGLDPVNRVLIMANFFPWEYSSRQMRSEAEQVVRYQAESQGWQILRPPSPVRTGGITAYWSDLAGKESSGAQVLTRIYLFAWNDIEYFFACQEDLNSEAGIIRGCDRIFSTLHLGTPR